MESRELTILELIIFTHKRNDHEESPLWGSMNVWTHSGLQRVTKTGASQRDQRKR